MFSAYLITNRLNNKQYVGITTGSIAHRFKVHLKNTAGRKIDMILYDAIRKYGVSNFSIEHVACASSVADLKQVEAALIAQYGTLAPHGYNATLGGEGTLGFKHSAETKAKIAAWHKGRVKSSLSEEHKQSISKALIGKTLSEKHRQNISAGKREKRLSEEHRQNIGAAQKGKILSAEQRKKISEALSGRVRSKQHCENLSKAKLKFTPKEHQSVPALPA